MAAVLVGPGRRGILDVIDDADSVASNDPAVVQGLLGATPGQVLAKRIVDVVGALAMLVLAAPLLAIIAVLVRATSRGPALFVQERVGRDGTPFRFYKFRSMRVDAEEVRAELESDNEATGPVFKIKADPRITSVGRILRALSLDELPQLVSVLAGSMSLVGPRPPLPTEVQRYSSYELQRLAVTPGLTCIWQVSGRSDICFEEWVEMDLAYIRRWSLALDLRILVQTLPAVLSGRGAY